jgi:hypothetical protein
MFSLEVPNNWAKARMPDAVLSLFGPEVDNYRMNVSVSIHQINPHLPDSFDNLIQASYFSGNMERSLDQFHLAESAKFTLDGHEAFQALMQWIGEEDGVKVALTQLDVLMKVNPDTVYEIHAYTLRQHEVTNIPILEHILGSIRIIPPKPAPVEEPYHFDISPN